MLTPIDLPELSGTPVLLVNPRIPLSTAQVYDGWDGMDGGPLGDWREGRNDLEAPAMALVPEIGVGSRLALRAARRVLRANVRLRPDLLRIFRSEAARDAAANAVPSEWWHLATFLR